MSDHSRSMERTSLNGWWDFLPVTGQPQPGVPTAGWLERALLVPSFWTKLPDGVRQRGDSLYANRPNLFTETPDLSKIELLFDAFGYPSDWSRTRCGWIRRTVRLPPRDPARRSLLCFDAMMPKGTVFINGQRTVTHIHPTLPLDLDVTDLVREGDNEIAVLIEDYTRDDQGRPMVPSGNWIPLGHCGIWQDVAWVERNQVHVSDVTIRTAVREQRLQVIFEVTNASARERRIRVQADIRPWKQGRNPEATARALAIPEFELALPPRSARLHTVAVAWSDARPWWPESPSLYTLRTAVCEGDTTLDVSHERFGFREVWIDGPHLMLNGYPMHLFSDGWGHKLTPYYYTEAWMRKWIGMLRDAHMNHTRLCTHPHPPLLLDLADEEGILITGETGLHGSSGGLAGDEPEFWRATRDHIRRFVRRDKNHPSIVLWSVANEMRWLPVKTRLTFEQLPELRRYFNELDPTRPAYHEGDSSLWNEADQPIISRHYQKSCAGIGWWDRRQPLHAGEVGIYHYAGPNNTSHLAGDRVWASFRELDQAAALDTALIIETARTLGVCCLSPWTVSCMENLRMERRLKKLKYRDLTLPGVKPLQVPAYSSEFNFWDKGKGYTRNYGFNIQKRAFRPLALIDRSLRTGYFAGAQLRRELYLVNDTTAVVSGRIEMRIMRAGKNARPLYTRTEAVTVARGQVGQSGFDFTIPASATPGTYVYSVQFKDGRGRRRDGWKRTLRITRRTAIPGTWATPLIRGRIAVFGPGSLRKTLDALCLDCHPVTSLAPDQLQGAAVLIVEKNAVVAGSRQNLEIQAFVRAGGRVLVMAQTVSIFPGLPIAEKPLQKNFIRAYGHPIFDGLREQELAFWSEAPYPLLAGDAYVAERMFRKNDATHLTFLTDGDEGGFGSGGLAFAGLVESFEEAGIIVACQLRLTERMADMPAAERLFINLLKYVGNYRKPASELPLVVSGTDSHRCNIAAVVTAARAGRNVIVQNADSRTLAAYARALRVQLRPRTGKFYQAVRVKEDPCLRGISNEDTCGITTFSYTSGAVNHMVATTGLAPARGLESLLQTPTENCLDKLFVQGGQTEPLRATTLSLVRAAPKPEPAVLLGRVRTGRGQILFNQFAPPAEGREALKRLGHRLFANLGGIPVGSALDGPAVQAGGASSPGYPQRLHLLNVRADEALRRRLLESTRFILEHIDSTPILGIPGWRLLTSETGQWSAAELDLEQDIYFYSQVLSRVARKDVSSNLGIPNPDILTFLRLVGKGEVEVVLNGTQRASLVLDGEAAVSDIPLEAGGNHVLIRWRPPSKDATLSMYWHDIEKRPETDLKFR